MYVHESLHFDTERLCDHAANLCMPHQHVLSRNADIVKLQKAIVVGRIPQLGPDVSNSNT